MWGKSTPFGQSLCWLNPGWSGNLPPSVYSARNKNPTGRTPCPSFSQQFNWRCCTWNGGSEKIWGKLELFPSAWQQLNERACTSPPLRGYWVLRQQTQLGTPVGQQEVTLHGNAITQKIKVSLWGNACFLLPANTPSSSAAGSGDSLTSLFPLAWSQLLKRCDYPPPLAPLLFEEEFWHHLSSHQLCFPQFSDL